MSSSIFNIFSAQDGNALSDDEEPMVEAVVTTTDDVPNLSADTEGAESEVVKPGDVDAFWLQRELNKHYNDADVSQVI